MELISYHGTVACVDEGSLKLCGMDETHAVNHLINSTRSEVLYMALETMLANDLVIRYLE